MDFDSRPCEDDLPILQLRKWGPSEFPYNPSDFREGFISPTRKSLLLLSHDSEALFIPLDKGRCMHNKDFEVGPDETVSYTPEQSVPCSSGARGITSNSYEYVGLDSGVDSESGFSSSGTTDAFISGVDSVAWGLCGDTHGLFEEVLFVSGSHGVVAHAFSHANMSRKGIKSAQGSDIGEGKWVEWGPSMELTPTPEVQEGSKSQYQAFGDMSSASYSSIVEDRLSESPKTWLHTFLAKVDRPVSGSDVHIKFPNRPLFPNCIVSFRIFDRESHLLDLFPDNLSSCDQANGSISTSGIIEHKSDRHDSSFSLSAHNDSASDSQGSSLYKCVKVFSNNSYQLIGFVLSTVNPADVKTSCVNDENHIKIMVSVARLVSWGIQWVYSRRLEENLDKGPFEWADFTFSHKFLVCLSTSGLISLYGATTGAYIASLHVVNNSVTRCSPSFQEQKSDSDVHKQRRDNLWNRFCQKRFMRLLVFPHSLLGVMDECGVTYTIRPEDHVMEEHSSFEERFSCLIHPDIGLLTGWEVGRADIGYRRVLHGKSPWSICRLLEDNKKFHFVGCLPRDKHLKNKDNQYVSHVITSPATQIMCHKSVVTDNLFTREVFLPPYGYNKDDVICCSPFGITHLIKRYSSERNWCQVVHSNLQLDHIMNDEMKYSLQVQETSFNEAVGCNFHGFLYLVTEKGLSVVLPSISVSPIFFPVEAIGYRIPNCTSDLNSEASHLMGISRIKNPWSTWKVEILDRILLYEGPEVAEKLCLESDWGLHISRVRHLQLALNYLDFDEVENSLKMLMGINLEAEGILRLLFVAVSLMCREGSSDSAVSAASRLLALATGYATRAIRKYGLLQCEKVNLESWAGKGRVDAFPLLELTDKEYDEDRNSGILEEVALFLVVIRRLQGLINAKFKRPGQELADGAVLGADTFEDESKVPVVSEDALLMKAADQLETAALPTFGTDSNDADDLSLARADRICNNRPLDTENLEGAVMISDGNSFGRTLKVENPKDMIERWEMDNMDFKTIVKDALLSGRLPLAVLRLHIHHQNNLLPGKEARDTFNDVRIAGRAIAYDLFVKGETKLAITTLQKLGEDVETYLKQLLFGAVRRSLRIRVADEMNRYGYLGPHELKILEMVSLIERVYPCNSFFNTLATRQKELKRTSDEDAPKEISLHLLHPLFKNVIISCGEIDGVVLGSWTTVNEHSVSPEIDDDNSHVAYWTAAVAWSDAWDKIVIDRVLLDQPLLMGVNVLWESQLEYHVCHNDWLEVSKLLDVVPSYALSFGSLSIRLDDLNPVSSSKHGQGLPAFSNFTDFLEELDAVCMNVPSIRIFRLSANVACSDWLRVLMEQQLMKKFIFLADYWHSTADIVPLMARSGFMTNLHENPFLNDTNGSSSDSLLVIGDVSINPDAVQALHKVVIHFCAQYNLLNLLDIYLDFHALATDQSSLSFFLDSTGDNEWARCLLLLRIKGKEYDASFSNARAVVSRNLIMGKKLTYLETDDFIQAVDDIAEGAGEIAAVATLMYAPIPLQECISSGSVNRNCSSAQCTLENLKPAIQEFPTLCNTLLAACFGQDTVCNNTALKTKVAGYSDLLDYLNWREGVFFSSVRDTSILQMIPCWFPKSVRRLVQLYVQGPIGWQSLADSATEELSILRDIYYVVNSSGHTQISATSWEASVQKHIEEELYVSLLEGARVGLEHYLHRGRALAALNHLLSARVHKLKSDNKNQGQHENTSVGQTNVQSYVKTLLGPITESEVSLLSSVIPLAIEHFSDTVLVASCAFLLELCSSSASILRVDVAALRRISSFYKSADNSHYRQLSPKGSAHYPIAVEIDVTESLARALADDYLHKCSTSLIQKGDECNSSCNQPSRALLLVLHHLERASLPPPSSGMTCGSWLSSGNGNGSDLRSQQKATSQHWQLVTAFCQMHNIPLSTKYLAVLAKDNDWVGFLSDAQIGMYPIETVIQVASKEFSDPRLKIHVLTVLKSMQSRKKIGPSNLDAAEKRDAMFLTDENLCIPVELFGIIADCEKQERPGEALLLKAKNLCWSILAMIASYFPDLSPLSCLTVWLEITAARETSTIKVNDIASQIAKNVGAAVNATNCLPAGSRITAFHYNRKNSKRRRLSEPISVDSSVSAVSENFPVSGVSTIGGVIYQEEKLSDEGTRLSTDSDNMGNNLSRMVAVLCEQHLFLPLLQAFDIFLPSCSLSPFIRALQAFSQMRLSEAAAHLGSFAARIKEESPYKHSNLERQGAIGKSWTSSTAVKAADAMLKMYPSSYEKRCLLRLLSSTDFGDGGFIAARYGQLAWKVDMAEPSLRGDEYPLLGDKSLDDASLLTELEKNGYWEQARSWRQVVNHAGNLQPIM